MENPRNHGVFICMTAAERLQPDGSLEQNSEVLNEEVSMQDYTQQTDKKSVHCICVSILKAGHGERSCC